MTRKSTYEAYAPSCRVTGLGTIGISFAVLDAFMSKPER